MSADKTPERPKMSSDYDWKTIPQVRCGVLVSKVTEFLAANPREVAALDLNEWVLEQDRNRFAVVHVSGIANGILPYKVPNTLEGTMPVLVGHGNGRKFLIDGAHRVAKAILEKKKSISALILSEEETRACVREGQMERFDRETK